MARLDDLEVRIKRLEDRLGPPGGPGLALELQQMAEQVKRLEHLVARLNLRVGKVELTPAVYSQLQTDVAALAQTVARLERRSGGEWGGTPQPG